MNAAYHNWMHRHEGMASKNCIIPGILAPNVAHARRSISLLGSGPRWLQIDILDRTLVPFSSWRTVPATPDLFLKKKIELHLMVRDPLKYIRLWRRLPHVRRVIWHMEADVSHEKLIAQCRRWHLEVGLALSPHTTEKKVKHLASLVDEVLVLGVHPGKSGQRLLRATVQKAARLHKAFPRLVIGFDGGITDRNLPQLRAAGVHRFILSSALFLHADPAARFRALSAKLS